MKRIYVNRKAVMKNREAISLVRPDIIYVAHLDPDLAPDPKDHRQGCDRGAHSYDSGIRVDIEGPSTVVHDPQMLHGASVWVETDAPVLVWLDPDMPPLRSK